MGALRRSLETARKDGPAGEPKKSSGRTAARISHSPKQTGGKKSTSPKAATGKTTAKRASATGKQQLSQLTKAELYKRATDLDIPHRSPMTRDELQHALEHAGRPRRKAS
ncbi:hypothetical protein ACIG0C_34785 [Kitasatospora aureofaciens]|uniref:Rho termination factor N-terminal domain-containing protein n=1 Tax=Kitasatospora aureofaciens TaxID=1894 RepID=A0A1E7NEI0_KITAU|nr:hypothetical protein [Kitasatospora aureofaciens]ARF83280.1 hypothetical protein B6264_30565 [Kitasatospora aureofaciens]OEV39048.1 hypothetical protein HS99_0018295 [Kitasatospora aureofaciens]GGV03744.1 hypothetical protein GCM10010502_68080 [Kitasatospora aureofaciens]